MDDEQVTERTEDVPAALDASTISIGLFGSLNPQICRPLWLARQGLIAPEVARGLDVRPDHPALVAYEHEWFTLELSLERFLIFGPSDRRDDIRGLVEGIFQRLPHTPIDQVGVSYEVTLLCGSATSAERLMSKVLPLRPWGVVQQPATRSARVAGKLGGDESTQLTVESEHSHERPAHVDLTVTLERPVEAVDGVEGDAALLALGALAELWKPASDLTAAFFENHVEMRDE